MSTDNQRILNTYQKNNYLTSESRQGIENFQERLEETQGHLLKALNVRLTIKYLLSYEEEFTGKEKEAIKVFEEAIRPLTDEEVLNKEQAALYEDTIKPLVDTYFYKEN